MLSFELKKPEMLDKPDELEIYCDADGLKSLLTQLRFLDEHRTEHVDLMSAKWGGAHLDDSPQNASNTSIFHVKILLRS